MKPERGNKNPQMQKKFDFFNFFVPHAVWGVCDTLNIGQVGNAVGIWNGAGLTFACRSGAPSCVGLAAAAHRPQTYPVCPPAGGSNLELDVCKLSTGARHFLPIRGQEERDALRVGKIMGDKN